MGGRPLLSRGGGQGKAEAGRAGGYWSIFKFTQSERILSLRPGLNRVSVLSFIGEFFGTFFLAA